MLNNIILDSNDYTLSNALYWGNCSAHYQKIWSGDWGDRLVHAFITLAEAPPIISQIVSIAEVVLFHLVQLFQVFSANLHMKSLPDSTSPNSLTAAPHSQLSPPILAEKTHPFKQITVLNQNYRIGGFEECGFHALKNTLVGVGIALKLKGISNTDYECKNFYEAFHVFVKSYKENWNENDASIAVLNTALMELSHKNLADLDETKTAFVKMYRENYISLFNIAEERLGGLDHTNLEYLSNFLHLSRPGPFVHGIAIGTEGHWYTLILKKNEDNTLEWQGCDSYSTISPKLESLSKTLEGIITNPQKAFQTSLNVFENAVGGWIITKGAWLDVNGECPLDDEKQFLSNPKSLEDYLLRIKNTFSFIQKAGWLEKNKHPQIKNYLENLYKLTRFYELNFPATENHTAIRNISMHLQELIHLPFEETLREQMLNKLVADILAQENDKTYARPKLQSLSIENANSTFVLKNPPTHIQHFSNTATYFPYNAEGIRDYGWGCAWRAIQTSLSAYDIYMSLNELFHLFGPRENLSTIYNNIHLSKTLLHNQTFAPYELTSGWAEPFIGHMAMHFNSIESDLILINGMPNAHTPASLFDKTLSFSNFKEKLIQHFIKSNPAPVMLDDSLYTFNIVGIGLQAENLALWIADPHIKEGVKTAYNETRPIGLYTIILDNQGNPTFNSVTHEDSYQAPFLYNNSAHASLNFNSKHWMALFPHPRITLES